MLSKNQLKFIRSLHQAKYRKEHGLFLAEGPKVVGELLQGPFRVHSIYATEEWAMPAGKTLPTGTVHIVITQKELERISGLQAPNQVLALLHIPKAEAAMPLPTDLVLVLDGIRDPGNLGTIIRTADWYGIHRVICSLDCVELYNPKVVQASMGSITRVEVSYRDLAGMFRLNQSGFPVYGAVLEGSNIYDEKLTSNGYLLIGSESHGISQPLRKYITHPIVIPAYETRQGNRAESLNASVATAVLCAEFRRRSK